MSPQPSKGAVEALGCRREFPERSYERCGKPAEYIVWGKLFPKEALGPRCRDCLVDQCGHRAPVDSSYAIYKLPNLAALYEQFEEEMRERLKSKRAAEEVAEEFEEGDEGVHPDFVQMVADALFRTDVFTERDSTLPTLEQG